jgi:hypothetical protein
MRTVVRWTGVLLLLVLPGPARAGEGVAALESRLTDASGGQRFEILEQLAEAYRLTSAQDSRRVSEEALALARAVLMSRWGGGIMPR